MKIATMKKFIGKFNFDVDLLLYSAWVIWFATILYGILQ